MPRATHGRRSRSPSRGPDEDQDYLYALRVSAELNGEQSAPPAQHPEYDADAEFARAMQLQFDNEAHAAQDRHTPRTGSAWENSATPISGQSSWGLNKDESSIAEYHPETPSGLRGLTEFIAYMQSRKCKCGEPWFRSELDMSDMFQDWLNDKGPLSSWIKCRSCLTSSCFGCIPEPFVKQSKLKVQGKQVSWCCAGGRLFLIWVLLCGFDQHFCAARSAKQETKTQSQQKRRGSTAKTERNVRGGGVGFGGDHRHSMSYLPSGMGYDIDDDDMVDDEEFRYYPDSPHLSSSKGKGHTLDPRAEPANGRTKAQSAQRAEDVFNRAVLELLKGLLPSLDREVSFDVDPPEAVTDMLVESKILRYCAELLRNDSLDDVTKRKDLYHALLGFLQTLGTHVMANLTLFSERPVQPDAVNLLTLSFGRIKDASKETASSLADNLRNLNTQSVLVLQSAKANEKDFYSEDGQEMLLLCRRISELSQYIIAYTNNESAGNVDAYTADLAISDVPNEQILATHVYASTAESSKFSPPGRFKRLITEITTLKTGLPPGIFVRYCETRPDVLKIVIIGPGGTPYENGIFEFDFFCDANFPNKPPMVRFRGTGGGRVSINPNLYADGKVCLSLLGTWSGEPWKPSESTLLQVVISLQAMIFCEEPWYNEPGREIAYNGGPGKGPAAAYNRTIREYTVRHAMLTWLDRPPQLWQAVVEFHFKQNANNILQTVEQWVNTKPPTQTGRRRYAGFEDMEADELLTMGGSYALATDRGDLASMVPRLQSALQKYGGTHAIQHTPQPNVQQAPARRVPVPPPTISYPMPPNPMVPLPLGPPPPYSATQPMIPSMNPGHQPRGGSWGMGRALGSGDGQSSHCPTNTAPNSRGGSVFGVLSDARGRYETRSTTRGRGEPAGPVGLMGGTGGSSSNAPATLSGRGSRGRGGPATPRGRGDRGVGRGGRGGLAH